jgi:hypothetical protein
MARYSATHVKVGVNTANTIMWQMRAASTQRLWVLEIALAVVAAPTTGPSWRLNRPTAVGTSTATVTPQPEDPDVVASTGLLDTTWSANPTLGGTDLRTYATPNSIGSGIVWTWSDQPLVIPKSGGIALVNANATGGTVGSFSVYVIYLD